jgi:hypothetical protein
MSLGVSKAPLVYVVAGNHRVMARIRCLQKLLLVLHVGIEPLLWCWLLVRELEVHERVAPCPLVIDVVGPPTVCDGVSVGTHIVREEEKPYMSVFTPLTLTVRDATMCICVVCVRMNVSGVTRLYASMRLYTP